MAIYVKFAEEEKPKSIKEFLTKFFSSQIEFLFQNVTTYNNKECTSIQCAKNKHRSFDEVLELVQTYYKTATPKNVFKTLLDLVITDDQGKKYYLYMMSCSGIQRINLLYYRGREAQAQTKYENICNNPKLTSKYDWKELFAMIDINSDQDFTKYLKENEK